ncbi:hypothetical protein ACGC1H_003450 [Rhizoctonia solani]
MSRSNTSCTSCLVRKRKCNGARPVCRHCARDKLECGGYSDASNPIRGGLNVRRTDATYPVSDINTIGLVSPDLFAAGRYYQPWESNISSAGQPSSNTLSTSPSHPVTRPFPHLKKDVRQSMTPGQASLFDALLSLARPEDNMDIPPSAAQSGPRHNSQYDISNTSGRHNQANIEDVHDVEEVGAKLCDPLALDKHVQSNALPFVLQSYTLWMAQFFFEPVRIIPFAREFILKQYSQGPVARWRMMTISNAVHEITESTEYTLEAFAMLEPQMYQGLNLAPSYGNNRAADRLEALLTMSTAYEFISVTLKVYPLSKVVKAIQVMAPVFRRGCPDPEDGLVNLPNLLSDVNLAHFRYFAILDILTSMVINRPMNFRYDTTYDSRVHASFFELENALGMCCVYGVPDKLVIMFARMSALLEDFGSGVDPRIIKDLEVEITDIKPIAVASADPRMVVGRLVVQECWRQAAYIYLYMGLCGADSRDARVIKAHSEFMKMLVKSKPGRIPDAFLILPLPVLGIATCYPDDQEYLKRRMLALPECARKGTTGNQFVRMLECIWDSVSHSGQPATWSDLRLASLWVAGV